MAEETPRSEGRDLGSQPWFSMLDIVKIDGRWAQIVGGLTHRGDADGQSVIFLDNKSRALEYVDFREYKLARHLDRSVRNMLASGEMSQNDSKNIHWDSDNIGTDLALEVTVFDEFVKKDK